MAPAPAPSVLAVDLGGTGIKAEVVGPHREVVARGRRDTPSRGGPPVLSVIAALGQQMIAQVPAPARPQRVGLAVPGLVDTVAGIGVLSANLGWRNAPVAAPLARELDLPVVMFHDVAAAGLAEHRLGAGAGCGDVAVVVIGTGIAAALVVNGQLVRGGLHQAGELGHVVVRQGGTRCGCGRRGCLEAVASASAIARRYSERSGREVRGARDVRERLGQDRVADQVWAEAVDALADGLLGMLALLSCARIVVGGGLAAAGDALLDPLRRALVDRATVEAVPEIVPAALGARAGLVGAALGALHPALLHAAVHHP